MPKYLATSLALASVAVLAGCTGSVSDNDSYSSTPMDVDADASLAMNPGEGLAGIAEELRDEGMTVNFSAAQSSAQPIFPLATPYTLSVNGQDIQAYEYASEDAAQDDEGNISADGSMVEGTTVTWVGTPHFYRYDNVILVYLGNNATITQALEDLAGPPFAGEGAAGAATGTGETL